MQLRVQDLTKSYSKNIILKRISLSIPKGQFISLLGPSGSGKTTLLRCIAGLETHESGSVVIEEMIQSDGKTYIAPENRNIGMVFQSYALWPHMTVFQNVAYPLRLRKDRDFSRKVLEALDLVKLGSLEKRYPHELSGGQQQRVALARALVVSPRLLLLDEPLSNLDALLRDDLGREIRSLQKKLGLTAVMVTHDQKEATSFSDHIVLLNHGEIDCEGSPQELYQNPPTKFAAIFLTGGYLLQIDGMEKTIQPRKVQIKKSSKSYEIQVTQSFFRGHEYEIWGESAHFSEFIRFFSSEKVTIGSCIHVEI